MTAPSQITGNAKAAVTSRPGERATIRLRSASRPGANSSATPIAAQVASSPKASATSGGTATLRIASQP